MKTRTVTMRDGLSVDIYASSHGCPPGHTGQAPARSSIWLNLDDQWWDIGQMLSQRSILGVASSLSMMTSQELLNLVARHPLHSEV